MSAAGSPRLAEPQALTDILSLLDYEPEHHWFRGNVRAFVRGRILPFHGEWESAGIIDGSLFTAAGKRGLLGFSVPEKLGGPAVDDVRHNAIVVEEEVNRVGAAAEGIALTLQNVVLPYLSELTTGEQKARWLPSVVTTDTVLAIAMTEPGAESDLTGIRTAAVRDGDHYVVGGAPKCSFPTAATATCWSWPRRPRRTSTRG